VEASAFVGCGADDRLRGLLGPFGGEEPIKPAVERIDGCVVVHVCVAWMIDLEAGSNMAQFAAVDARRIGSARAGLGGLAPQARRFGESTLVDVTCRVCPTAWGAPGREDCRNCCRARDRRGLAVHMRRTRIWLLTRGGVGMTGSHGVGEAHDASPR
jgi:hypothetical protein